MAKYRFEDLGDIDFQKLCQAIALHVYPDLQALPTRQPDGGFDAFVLGLGGERKELAFQVKWVADTREERDPVKWLDGVVRREEKNLHRMVQEGTKRWTLMTNVSGTSHHATGTIDRLNRALAAHSARLGIEMVAWWRDDLARRLEHVPWEVKLSYPDMLVGFDAMRAVLFAAFEGGRRARILDIVRQACRADWDSDQDVRFKHGELDGVALQDIFLDVEVSQVGLNGDSGRTSDSSVQLGLRGGRLQHTLVFGAPGQGKSTLSIFLAQLHRARLVEQPLPMGDSFGDLLEGRERVPLRLELRDYATWLTGLDPTDPLGERKRPRGSGPSVEAYVAHLVQARSGDRPFSVEDLASLTSWLPIIYILDGLDEVGDPELRSKVVSQINDLASRHPERDAVAVLVTSRPNYEGAPEPTNDLFAYYELRPLDEPRRAQYKSRWVDATKLLPAEVVDLNRVYKQRIDEPHVQELATNPMQLAILLSLMHRRGDSIPADRTELYESYMQFFLDRESVTDANVKKHRPQLEAITAFLGWHLHADAESGGSGRASRVELIYQIKHHLLDLGEDPTIAEVLFTAVTQRVWVLSSRTAGSFEFDVQTIREFFAARYLFDTAPSTSHGDTLDRLGRFRELLVRPFWTNVARFMGGMFTRGETSGLADVVVEEIQSGRKRFWIRRLGRTLIDDGVFDDSPRARERVIAAVHDEVGLTLMSNGSEGSPPVLFVGAPSSVAIATTLRTSITDEPRHRLAPARARLLARYRSLDERNQFEWWLDRLRSVSSDQAAARWLYLMGCAEVHGEHVPANLSDDLFGRFPATAGALLAAGAQVRPGSELERKELDIVVSGAGFGASGRGYAADLLEITSPSFLWGRSPIPTDDDEVLDEIPDASALRRIAKRGKDGRVLSDALKIRRGARQNSLPWSLLANALYSQFGRSWIATRVAIDGVAERRRTLGVANTSANGADSKQGSPSALMALLRKHGDDVEWWTARGEEQLDDFDRAALALALITCTKSPVLAECIPVLDALTAGLPVEWLEKVSSACAHILHATGAGITGVEVEALAWDSPPLVRALLLLRAGHSNHWRFTSGDVAALAGIPGLQHRVINTMWLSLPADEAPSADLLKALTLVGSTTQLVRRDIIFKTDLAEQILASPTGYPTGVVIAAEASVEERELAPLFESAREWFAPYR